MLILIVEKGLSYSVLNNKMVSGFFGKKGLFSFRIKNHQEKIKGSKRPRLLKIGRGSRLKVLVI